MRTLVDIPDDQIDEITMICAAKKKSRAEIIRQAIAAFIEINRPSTMDAFGLLKNKGIDGVDYQQEIRSEW